MKLKDVIAGIDILNIGLDQSKLDTQIAGIAYDNRNVEKNYLFCALVGAVSDGHKYIHQAIKSGAAAIICQDATLSTEYSHTAFIKVSDSRLAAALASHNYFSNPSKDMEIIGVTGTNGKTTTTFIIANMLKKLGNSVGIIGTTGIYINDVMLPSTHTTPESLELAGIIKMMKNDGADTVVMEVSSHALVQHRATGIDFSAALFTNLTHEHLDYHKTMDEYADAKKILFDNLDEKSLVLAINNSKYADYVIKDTTAERKIKIGYEDDNDIVITNCETALNYSKFTLKFNNLQNKPTANFQTKLIGKFNIENAALAVSYLILNGVSVEQTTELLKNADGAPGRMDRITISNGAVAVVDYAHTPDALEKALSACKELLYDKPDNKLICTFGCGGDRDNSKRPEMGKISADIADITIITDDNPRTENPEIIREQIVAGITNKQSKYKVISPREEAIKAAADISIKGDIILIAGKGHENYQIIGNEKFHFDDKEIISKL